MLKWVKVLKYGLIFFVGDEGTLPQGHGPFEQLFAGEQRKESQPNFFPGAILLPLIVATPAGDVGTKAGREFGPLATIEEDIENAIDNLTIINPGSAAFGGFWGGWQEGI